MNLGMPEMLFIFLLALIIFGPKKMPEIGRQIGKALSEFKRASNEFKMQIEDEIRQMEYDEEQKRALAARNTGAVDANSIAPIEPAVPLGAIAHGQLHEGETPEQHGAAESGNPIVAHDAGIESGDSHGPHNPNSQSMSAQGSDV